MDIVRRNTDYALRAMIHLAKKYGGKSISTRVIAEREDISYQLACKLMQKMNEAGLVTSTMGPKGGFALSKEPSQINLLEIIEAVQGPLSVNRCLSEEEPCPRKDLCPLSSKMKEIQDYLVGYLSGATLGDL
ncbi:MAG: Rrf2 family transcriptional regulator [Planctomycetes bacterium]|nr:Rrf2 family transcriptional regulator [Planctomycetota bacterium]